MCLFINASTSVIGFLKNVNFTNIVVFSWSKPCWKCDENVRENKEQWRQIIITVPQKRKQRKDTQIYQKRKTRTNIGNIRLLKSVWFQSKKAIVCQPRDGEKSYFLLLMVEQHKHRSSEREAGRKTDKTDRQTRLIKRDSDSHINLKHNKIKNRHWLGKSMGEVNGVKPQQVCEKSSFQAASHFLQTCWEASV